MKNWFITFYLLSCMTFSFGQNEYLIVFAQDTSSSFADKHFTDNYLKPIRTFAEENDLKLIERKAEDGVFEQTTYTPAIYFVNDINFSLYKGRYTETNRLFNFIRSSYSIPKKEKNIKMEDVFTMVNQKSSYLFPLKVTEPSGENDKKETYKKLINDELRKDIEINNPDYSIRKTPVIREETSLTIKYKQTADLPYSTRKYYIDIHPHITKNKLYLSVNVFSEFNCKKPIYETKEPFEGNLKNYKAIIEEAKQETFKYINYYINTGTNGDAHTYLKENNQLITLLDLNISIEKNTTKQDLPFPKDIQQEWTFSSAVNDNTPLVQFQIPNTIYMGEVQKLAAHLNLTDMTGYATADITSLTLGDYGLDESVLERVLAKKFKTSNISFKEIVKGKEQKISAFEDYEYLIKCDFTFVGKTVEEEIILTITPFIKDSELFLQCQSTFDIQLNRQFGIDSGVGESFEEDTVEFYINYILKNKNK